MKETGITMNKQTRPNLSKKLLCALIATAFACQTWAAGLTASVNSNKIGLNEQFQLTLSSDEMGGSPNLSPLQKDFQILGTSQSSQIQIINGRTSQLKKWIITLSPNQLGRLNIPAITMGKTSSQPIAIDVVKGNTIAATHQGQIAITANIDNVTHYQFQEIPLTVRIETNVPLQQAELIAPASADFEMSQTGADNSTQMVKGGKRITVIERHYLLRPQKAGNMTIPSFVLRGYLQGKRRDPFANFRRQFGGFDDFFSSPFDNMVSRGEPFAAKSRPLALSVKAANNAQTGEWFLPAKSVQLQAQWQTPNPAFKVGEAVTRKIDLIALGATPEQLPKLTFPNANGVKFYIDSDKTASRETPQGTQALREVTVSIVPTQAGKMLLPEVQVKWLNTQTNQQAIAVLPAQTITVQGEPVAAVANQHVQKAPTQNEVANKKQPQVAKADESLADKYLFGDNNFLVKENLPFIGSIVAGIVGLFIILVVIFRRKRVVKTGTQVQANTNANTSKEESNTIDYFSHVEKALQRQDSKQLYKALLQWQRSGVTFTEELTQHFQRLEQLCYQPNSEIKLDWQRIGHAIQQQKSLKEKSVKSGEQLPPLYWDYDY